MSAIMGNTWKRKFSRNVFMEAPRLRALVTSPMRLLRWKSIERPRTCSNAAQDSLRKSP